MGSSGYINKLGLELSLGDLPCEDIKFLLCDPNNVRHVNGNI